MEHLDHQQEDPLAALPALALAATTGDPPTSQLPSISDTDRSSIYWNGTKEHLRSWHNDVELNLSMLSPILSQLAIESFVIEKGEIIFRQGDRPGQLY